MKKNIMAILGCLCLLLTTTVYSNSTERRLYKDAVSMGMGGVGVSTIGYSFSAIHNPAALGLMADHDIAPFLSLGMSMNPEMFDVLNDIGYVASGDQSFDSIDYDSLIGKAPKISANGPLSLGYMGKGFGIWTTTSSEAGIVISNSDAFINSGLNVSMNDLAKAGSAIIDLGDNPTQAQIEDIVNKYFGDDLTPEQMTKFVTDLHENPSAIKDLLPKARFDATAEITVNLAYGYRIPFAFLDDVSGLSFGATVRFSQRFKVSSESSKLSDDHGFVPVDQLGNTFGNVNPQVYQAGSISSDFGAALRLENFIFGVSLRDAFSTGYYWKNSDGVSGGMSDSKIAMSLDFGASYRFYFNSNFLQEVGVYVEFEDSLNEHESWLNKMRVGSEVKLFNFLDLRVGMYDTFITGGVGVGWKWFRMDFAYYRENYFNFFVSDQYYLNMTIGLDNSPQRKARSLKQQQQHDRIQAQALELVNSSLAGIGI